MPRSSSLGRSYHVARGLPPRTHRQTDPANSQRPECPWRDSMAFGRSRFEEASEVAAPKHHERRASRRSWHLVVKVVVFGKRGQSRYL